VIGCERPAAGGDVVIQRGNVKRSKVGETGIVAIGTHTCADGENSTRLAFGDQPVENIWQFVAIRSDMRLIWPPESDGEKRTPSRNDLVQGATVEKI